MNNNNDFDDFASSDSADDAPRYSDDSQPLLPDSDMLMPEDHVDEDATVDAGYVFGDLAESPTDRLKILKEAAAESGVDTESDATDGDAPSRPKLPSEGRADRVAALVTALAGKQQLVEAQEKQNENLLSQVNEQSARLQTLEGKADAATGQQDIIKLDAELGELRKLTRELEDQVAEGADENADLLSRLEGSADYVQALNQQAGKLDEVLGSLSETQTWVEELDSALDEDLEACAALAGELKQQEGQLAQLESLVELVCSNNRAAEDASARVRQLTQGEIDAYVDVDEATETPIEGQAVNRLMIAMNGDHVIKYPLYKSIVTIGRGPFNDIQIRTQYVSRSHARIVTDGAGAMIEDMNSKNGITVNGKGVQLRRLQHGDVVDVGKVHFRFIDLMADEAGEGTA